MKKYTEEVKVGIFETESIIRFYKTYAVITYPYIQWENGSGNLDH